jgi:hypothetical protein
MCMVTSCVICSPDLTKCPLKIVLVVILVLVLKAQSDLENEDDDFVHGLSFEGPGRGLRRFPLKL